MEILSLVILLVILYVFIKIISNKNHTDDNKEIETSIKIYKEKPIMTEPEKNFYYKLKNLEPTYKVIPQVSLSSIIEKIENKNYHTDLFRNIDYGIFTNDFSKVLLLIELNDQTHNQPERKKRDIKVHKICQNANIPIMTFYTSYPNETEYVLNRIITELNKNIVTPVVENTTNTSTNIDNIRRS